MPCATVHLLVADLALRQWSNGVRPPFRLTNETRDAFLHGSLAPDVGFIPGVDRFVSELAHYHRPADLARALMSRSSTAEQQAFSWGWVSHVLGDVEIHPIVGRAVGERIHGSRDIRMDAAEDVETHVSVEVGLDIAVRARAPDTSNPPRRPLFDDTSMGWISDALESVYHVRWTPQLLAKWHRTAVHRTRHWPNFLSLLERGAGEWRAPRRPVATGLLTALSKVPFKRTPARGFLSPRKPPGWVMAQFDRSVDRVLEDLMYFGQAGIDALPNRNLESGLAQEQGDAHPASIAVRNRLSVLNPGRRESGATGFDSATPAGS